MIYLKCPKKVVSDQRVEAMLTEAVDVSDEVGAHGEVSGAFEKGFGGGTEAAIALNDLLDRIVSESVQNP